MVGQVPSTRPPGYTSQFGDMLTQQSAARGEAVAAELDARASALGDILGNIKGIAEVGGGNIAPDLLIERFAGGQTPIFTNDYAGTMDNLRLADMVAGIGQKNRSGRSGGGAQGGGMTMDPRTRMVTLTDAEGNVIGTEPIYDVSEFQELRRAYNSQGINVELQPFSNVGTTQVATKGKNSAGTPVVTGGTPKDANEVISPDIEIQRTDPDGTIHFSDGSTFKP